MNDALSARQADVLTCFARGLTAKQVGSKLGIHKLTVDAHLREARWKLGALNRTHAVALAISLGYIGKVES